MEISIPLFLRPVMQEILSIGKSVKIIRYLDKVNVVKAGFESFQDFKTVFERRLKDELSVLYSGDGEDTYFDEKTSQPSAKLTECAL